MLSSSISAYASNTYNTSEVDSFVNEMHEKYDYKKDDLKKLFANIREEQKLKKFFKKAPERRLTWNGCDSIEEKCKILLLRFWFFIGNIGFTQIGLLEIFSDMNQPLGSR